MRWMLLALLSAFCTAATATLAKAGLKDVDSNLGAVVQTVVVLACTSAVVAFQGKLGEVTQIDRRSLLLLIAAGVVTSVAYLAYYAALKQGEASRVGPLDRLSLVFGIAMAAFFLKEKVGAQVMWGAGLMAAGAVVIALAKQSR